MEPLARALLLAASQIETCAHCGNWDEQNPCRICSDPNRQERVVCVVESVADLWALERSRAYDGLYHVLGGTLSALEGRGPGQLRIADLLARASAVEEVILALNATLDGQTTSQYIAQELMHTNPSLIVTQLAQGVPLGGELDYLDEMTLFAALQARRAA